MIWFLDKMRQLNHEKLQTYSKFSFSLKGLTEIADRLSDTVTIQLHFESKCHICIFIMQQKCMLAHCIHWIKKYKHLIP